MDYQDLINRAYQGFNAKRIDDVLELLHPDVQWPNGWEGGYIHGHNEVRSYWLRQWKELDPTVTPISIRETTNGQIDVLVHQVVNDRQGNVVADGLIKHLYTIEDGKIKRMDIVNA